MNETKLVFTALNAVRKDLVAIGLDKTSRNEAQKFNFRGIDAMYDAIGRALAKHKLEIVPSVIDYKRDQITAKSGSVSNQTIVHVKYHFFAEDGSCVHGESFGEAQDFGDKSMSKAMTMAYKYFLLETFCIPLKGEVDPDSETYDPPAALITAEQATELQALADEVNFDINKVLSAYTVSGNKLLTSLTQISGEHFEKIKTGLNSKRAK